MSYGYDKLNRLTSSIGTGITMNETIAYDVPGNIDRPQRDNGGDNKYHYHGSQLWFAEYVTNGYNYDQNGNAISDGRTGFHFDYNMLNLLRQVRGTNNQNLVAGYTYDATGNKLKKITPAGTINYISGIQYKTDNSIDFIQTEEGLARNNGSGNYSYEYNLSDHLGNVRTTFYKNPNTNQLEVLQRDDYYAFGLRKEPVAEAGTKKYLYTSKELQEELGQLDYGARFYDPLIGRWNVVDPLAEKGRRWSPCNYGFDNPISHTDPDGMWPNPIVLLYDAPFRKFTSNTTNSFVKTGASNGVFNSGGIGITKVGRVYENAVLNSLGENENTKSFSPSSFGPKVIPDMVGGSGVRSIDVGNPRNIETQMTYFPQASFVDVKFKSNVS